MAGWQVFSMWVGWGRRIRHWTWCAWHLLEPLPRQAFRVALGCGDLAWERGKAWAFEQAMGAVWYYVDSNPAMARMGRTTLERILATEPSV